MSSSTDPGATARREIARVTEAAEAARQEFLRTKAAGDQMREALGIKAVEQLHKAYDAQPIRFHSPQQNPINQVAQLRAERQDLRDQTGRQNADNLELVAQLLTRQEDRHIAESDRSKLIVKQNWAILSLGALAIVAAVVLAIVFH